MDPTLKAALAGLAVLVVEDDPDLLMLSRVVLRFAEARVLVARSAAEALERLRDGQPDVLVSDFSLPDRDGLELIREIRALRPEDGGLTPAVAMTGHTEAEVRSAALAEGYQAFLEKPATPTALVRAIAGVARSGAKDPPQLARG